MKHRTSAIPPSVTQYTGCAWLVFAAAFVVALVYVAVVVGGWS